MTNEPNDSNGLIPLTEVSQLLPRRRGKKTHYSTVYRWAMKGARGRVLESRLIGGVRYTTRAALRRFLEGEPLEVDEPSRRSDLRRLLYGASDPR